MSLPSAWIQDSRQGELPAMCVYFTIVELMKPYGIAWMNKVWLFFTLRLLCVFVGVRTLVCDRWSLSKYPHVCMCTGFHPLHMPLSCYNMRASSGLTPQRTLVVYVLLWYLCYIVCKWVIFTSIVAKLDMLSVFCLSRASLFAQLSSPCGRVSL